MKPLKPTVMIRSAQYDNCQAVVDEIFARFDPPLAGKKVVLKPNVLRGSKPHEGVTTHPAVLSAVLRAVEARHPASIIVGDNPGASSYGANRGSFAETGLLEAAGEYYENFGTRVRELTLDSQYLPHPAVSEAILEADYVINLPKFKTHGLTGLSGAIKNCYGYLPGAQKANLHFTAGNPYDFPAALLDVFSIRPPDLAIVDGILAMEGNGPFSEDIRSLGLILAGTDMVAVDAVIGAMMNFAPGMIRSTELGHARGFGEKDLDKIHVDGTLTIIQDYKHPEGYLKPERGGSGDFWARIRAQRPQVDEDLCTMCGTCAAECPAGAITMDGYPRVDSEKCIVCFCCQEKCPTKAIRLQPPQ